ncbi:MAG: tetratricopeptide repeat protein [Chitinivibrionales bacterium]
MQKHLLIFISLLAAGQMAGVVRAEKVLIYDEERGIISVDKEEQEILRRKKSTPPDAVKAPATAVPRRRSPNDIHVGREKDPPELYFRSGLEYFKNNDLQNALKNFQYAVRKQRKPEYLLWIGKTYRKMGRDSMMISLMKKIVNNHPDSDVADDALFEIAFSRQKEFDYNSAAQTYARLAEQYPFGVSYSNGHEFLEISRNQRKNMRAEMVTKLTCLGYKTDTPEDAYAQFQRNNGLRVSGVADAPTVTAIKDLYNARLEADAIVEQTKKKVSLTVTWGSVAGAILLFNLLAILYAGVRVKRTRKQLESLHALLLELDTSAL